MPLLSDRSGWDDEAASGGLAPSTRAFWSSDPQTNADRNSAHLAEPSFGQETLRQRTALSTRPRGLLSTCANPRCGSGWLHLWRSRSRPIFEGGWSCSPSCTAVRIEAATRREMEGRRAMAGLSAGPHRHRIPLGLVMLEQGWITGEQLRRAMEAQRAAGGGKLGDWLVQHEGVAEGQVTRALSLQWSCPVLTLDGYDPERMAPLLPRLFVEAFGVLPLRVAAGSILYCGFEDRLDPVLTLAVERMFGLRVEAGVVRGSAFQGAHARLLNATFPRAELVGAESASPLVRAFSRAVERVRPVESRLVRVHDCLWLRMWTRPQTGPIVDASGVEDVIASLTDD